MMTVDKTASQPIYRQVIHALRERLERGELLPGGRAPSERELADLYDISRMTARGALRELIRDGLLYTVPGKGTFVAWPKMQQPLNTLTSFTEDMRARGLLAGTRVLGQGIEVSSSAVTERLRLSASAPVVVIRRVRLANEEPMCVETVHLDAERFGPLLRYDLAHRSLYDALNEFGVTLVRADQQIEATNARTRDATLLGVPRGSALLSIERTSYDPEDHPVEAVNSLYRGDRYRFNVQLQRGAW